MIKNRWYTIEKLKTDGGIEMDFHLLSKDYIVRRLDIHDVDIIYELSCENDIFINIIHHL